MVTVFFIAGFVAATHHWIIRPARADLDVARIASRLERHFPQLGERLSSTVSFLRQSDPGAPGIVERALADTERIVGELHLESVFTARPLAARGVLLGIAGVALDTLRNSSLTTRVAPA